MQAIYQYVQVVHLFFATIFVGYLFFYVVMLNLAAKKAGSETVQKIKDAIDSAGTKLLFSLALILVLTGGMMMSSWVNSDIGYFATTLQKLFMLKVLLGFAILILITINLVKKDILKNYHKHALIASLVVASCKTYVYDTLRKADDKFKTN